MKRSLTALIALATSARTLQDLSIAGHVCSSLRSSANFLVRYSGDTDCVGDTGENVEIFGFIPLPAPLLLAVIGLTALYVVATEITKKYFYAKADNASAITHFH